MRKPSPVRPCSPGQQRDEEWSENLYLMEDISHFMEGINKLSFLEEV